MAGGRKASGRALSRRDFLAGCTVVAASFALRGCAGGEEEEAGPSLAWSSTALDAPESGDFVVAESHADLYKALRASLSAAHESLAAGQGADAGLAAPAARLVAEAVAESAGMEGEEAAAAAEDPSGLYAGLAGGLELSGALQPENPLAAGDEGACLAVSDEGGWLFACDGADLYAVEAAGADTRKASAYHLSELDELSRWEECRGLFLDGQTLAVVGQLAADPDYSPSAPDYALAAYAAPRAMLAFIDVSDPEELAYLGCLGLTGSLQALDFSGGALTLVCAGPLVPAADAEGGYAEELDEEGFAEALDALELRRDDALSYAPSLFLDGNLEAFPAGRIYLPASGQTHFSVNLASFDVAAMSCSSVLSLCSPVDAAPALVCGEGSLIASWDECTEGTGEGDFSEDALVARIGLGADLSGMACARLEGSTASLLSEGPIEGLLLPGDAEGEDAALWRLARTGLALSEDGLSAVWTLQAFDEDLEELLSTGDFTQGAPLSSFSRLGGAFYLLSGGEEPKLRVIEVEEASGGLGVELSDGDAEAAAAWPAALLALDEGRFLACGSELERLAGDADWAALAPGVASSAEGADAAALRVIDLGDPARPAFGEALALDEELAAALESVGAGALQDARHLEDLQLVALPLIADEDAAARCALLDVGGGGAPALAGDIELPAVWAEEEDEAYGDAPAYEELHAVPADGAPCLFCRGAEVLPCAVALSGDGSRIVARAFLEEQVQLAE